MLKRGLISALVVLSVLALPTSAFADLTPNPPIFDFGNIDRHGQTAPVQFDFTNNQGIQVTAGPVILSGPDSGDFTINQDNCSGTVLNDTDICSIFVYADPNSKGLKLASIDIFDTLGFTSVPLSANAQTGTLTANPDPIVFTNPQPYYFGSQFQSVNLEGNGFGTNVQSISITGPDAALFSFAFDGCTGQTLFNNNTCGIGLNFNATGPINANATLEVVSDSDASPQSFAIQATAFAGPDPEVTPNNKDFGQVEVGDQETQAYTVQNNGDFQMQIQQLLVISGTSTMFPITNDTCSGQTVNPGNSCTFDLSFAPSTEGLKEASLFLITNTPQPITPVPVKGEGVAPPQGTAVVQGNPRVGETLICQDNNSKGTLTYQWIRDGQVINNETNQTYTLTNDDLGRMVACRITATNSLGNQSVSTSSEIGPVTPRDLSNDPTSFVGEDVCRQVSVEPTTLATISNTSPATAESPLTLTSNTSRDIRVNLEEISGGPGKVVRISPRRLLQLNNGPHTLNIQRGSQQESVQIVLADCNFSAKVIGGENSQTTYAVSGRTGVEEATIRTRSLSIDRASRKIYARVHINSEGRPDQVFQLTKKNTIFNSIRVEVKKHKVTFENLPLDTRRAQVNFKSGVVSGKNGRAIAKGTLLGDLSVSANVRTKFKG